MKIFKLFLLSLFVFMSCGGDNLKEMENYVPHKFVLDSENYYFFHPKYAKVEGEKIVFSYGECEFLGFGDLIRFKEILFGQEEFKNFSDDFDHSYKGELFRSGEADVFYSRGLKENGFGVWAFNKSKNITGCIDHVDNVFESLTDEETYMGGKYGFALDFSDDFEAKYLGDNLILTKKVDNYEVQIEVSFFPNFDDYGSVADYVSAEYLGFTVEGFESGSVEGYYVDEALVDSANRYFFTMNKSQDRIYKIVLTVPSLHFGDHLEEFDSIIRTLRVF
jgi:hypothetical protein